MYDAHYTGTFYDAYGALEWDRLQATACICRSWAFSKRRRCVQCRRTTQAGGIHSRCVHPGP